MFEAWDDGAPEHPENELEQDRISFDDSDRFEEDSICSYLSEAESACNNWQGWKKGASTGGTVSASPLPSKLGTASSFTDGATFPSLVEISARQVARHCPFEWVDHHRPPVPEQLQKRIAFWSFPDSEEDIRLYSCLAIGNAEEFQKGEHLYRAKLVKNLLQIGLHLNASVVPPQTNSLNGSTSIFNVAITFDRHRITSCSCTCRQSPTTTWCAHVVAVCLQRIHQPHSATLRAPLSESLSRLDKNQLWKFAQYFIQELPRQAMPTAQRLLDELMNVSSVINKTDGAPDPTAESSASEVSSWCLDENVLHENIRNLLVKFCIPSPTVCSDVNYLSVSSPPASAEWSNLLRPLRGREPEGMWNLLSIVKEMFRKADNNASHLLTILTDECLACEQIVVWWYSTKVCHGQSTTNTMGRMANGISTTAPQHASAGLMDETAALWKLAVLNPANTQEDREVLKAQLTAYHLKCIEKVRKSKGQNPNGQNVPGVGAAALRQSDIDLFPGFMPAVEVCGLDWKDYPVTVSRSCPVTNLKHVNTALKTGAGGDDRCPQIQGTHGKVMTSLAGLKLDGGSVPNRERVLMTDALLRECNSESDSVDEGPSLMNDSGKGCVMPEPSDRSETLYMRAEALLIHGYCEDARKISVMLAEELLTNSPDFVALEAELTRNAGNDPKLQRRIPHRITHLACATNVKLIFLVNVFSDSAEYRYIAFRIGLLGLEMPRPPAMSKALEVKMFHQELELMNLLKRIPLGGEELSVLRQKARMLRDGQLKSRGDALLPLNLATYIFSVFCAETKDLQQSLLRRNRKDEELGFEATVAALGMKPNVSEADHPLVCEGTRRQRGELACLLLAGYKDDQQKLERIMDRLLDKDIHSLRRKASSDSFAAYNLGIPMPLMSAPCGSAPQVDVSFLPSDGPSSSNARHNADVTLPRSTAVSSAPVGDNSEDSSALEDEKAWESKLRCTVFKPRRARHGESLGGIDSSAPETTSSDNSPTMVRRHPRVKHLREAESGSSGESSSDSRESLKKENDAVLPHNSTPKANVALQLQEPSTHGGVMTSPKGCKTRPRRSPTEPNQPSEAVAHFIFELAKTILGKAGGNHSTTLFQPSSGQNQSGPHRSLHMCAFQIGLYALGIHNCVCQNWQSRTYSSHVSWITGQAMEIGVNAISFLIGTWQDHLTPPEAALLADKASRSSDHLMVKAAAELALSVLPQAHAMNPHEIQRALVQCKEQSRAMLEKGLKTVEIAAKDGGVYPEALFDVSRKWYELYTEDTGEALVNMELQEVIFSNNQPDPGHGHVLGSALSFIILQQNFYAGHPHQVFYSRDGRCHFVPTHPFVHPYQVASALPCPSFPGVVHPGLLSQHMAYPAPQQSPYGAAHVRPLMGLPNYNPNYGSQYIMAAYHVGILAMETQARRVQDERWQVKYSRNPPYGEFVKWLLGISKKINVGYVQQFCVVAVSAVASPFVLLEIANEVANFLINTYGYHRDAISSGSHFILPLLQKSLHLFVNCIQHKIHHITPSEYEDFISTVVCMKAVSQLLGQAGQTQFRRMISEILTNRSCKKDLSERINAVANRP